VNSQEISSKSDQLETGESFFVCFRGKEASSEKKGKKGRRSFFILLREEKAEKSA